jgi:MFS family permease
LLLGAVITFTGLLAYGLLRQRGFVPTASPNPFVGLARAGRQALAQPLLRQAFVILVAGQFAFTVAQGVFAIYAGNVIEAETAATSEAPAFWNTGVGFTAIAMTITGLAAVLSSFFWGRLHDDGVPFLTPVASGLLAVSMFALSCWPVWWVVLVARAGVGTGVAAMSTLQFAVLSASAAPEERGQMMGLATALTHVGNLIGFVLGGILATWWTEPGNFALAAAVYVLILTAAVRLEVRLRRRRARRARRQALLAESALEAGE